MNDILGNEFGVGSRVVFSRPKSFWYPHSVSRGTVTKITDTRVVIELDEGFKLGIQGFAVSAREPKHFLVIE